MKPADRRGAWALWLSRIALVLAVGAVAAALVAALGTGAGTWSFRTGLAVLPFALFAAIGGAVLAIVAFLLGRNTGVRTGAMNAIAHCVEALYGRPMDIEWALHAGEVVVLQARPVTVAAREEWNSSRAGDYLWTCANLGEAIPSVMTPATWFMMTLCT